MFFFLFCSSTKYWGFCFVLFICLSLAFCKHKQELDCICLKSVDSLCMFGSLLRFLLATCWGKKVFNYTYHTKLLKSLCYITAQKWTPLFRTRMSYDGVFVWGTSLLKSLAKIFGFAITFFGRKWDINDFPVSESRFCHWLLNKIYFSLSINIGNMFGIVWLILKYYFTGLWWCWRGQRFCSCNCNCWPTKCW